MTAINEPGQYEPWSLPHGDQLVRFEGMLLGEASSEDFAKSQGRQRWHEVRVYRTTDGEYVVEKVGRSELPGETDRSTVHHSTTARGAIECLQTIDDDGVVYMTYVARTAVRQAAALDAEVREAYTVRDLTA